MIDLTNTMGKHVNVTYPVPVKEKMYMGKLGEVNPESFWNVAELPFLDEVEWCEDGQHWVDVDG
jgi:hypothetical protein